MFLTVLWLNWLWLLLLNPKPLTLFKYLFVNEVITCCRIVAKQKKLSHARLWFPPPHSTTMIIIYYRIPSRDCIPPIDLSLIRDPIVLETALLAERAVKAWRDKYTIGNVKRDKAPQYSLFIQYSITIALSSSIVSLKLWANDHYNRALTLKTATSQSQPSIHMPLPNHSPVLYVHIVVQRTVYTHCTVQYCMYI